MVCRREALDAGGAEEQAYSKWVESNITEDFYIRHNIRVDCADVPYASRWIYARLSHLPAAASTVNGKMIGNWSTDWAARHPTKEQWDQDRRFRTALLYMLSKTSTRTFPADTYPILVATQDVRPGAVFLASEDHAGIISRIVMDGSTSYPVQTLEAGSPARLQRLHLRDLV